MNDWKYRTVCCGGFATVAPRLGGGKRGRGFTLIELLVVIAIISLLISILIPSLQRAREIAKTVLCLTNERSIGSAFQMYASEHEDLLPPEYAYQWITGVPQLWGSTWAHYLAHGVYNKAGESPMVNLYCPKWSADKWGRFADGFGSTGGYAVNDWLDGIPPWMAGEPTQPAGYKAITFSAIGDLSARLLMSEARAVFFSGVFAWNYTSLDPAACIVPGVFIAGEGGFGYYGTLRVDHGTETVFGAPDQFFILPLDTLEGQNLNALFCDGHAETVSLGDMRYRVVW